MLRLATRDQAHHLAETMLLEFGAADPRRLASALEQMAGLIRSLGTPEKVAEFMVRNSVLQDQTKLVGVGRG